MTRHIHFRYYRSGKEMVRMASIYQQEKNYENAFILYIKFTTLFVEKIVSHPEYKTFDAVTKRVNRDKVMEVFPIAEKLKAKILERYEADYREYLARKQQEREADEARRKTDPPTAAATVALSTFNIAQITVNDESNNIAKQKCVTLISL